MPALALGLWLGLGLTTDYKPVLAMALTDVLCVLGTHGLVHITGC